jgi:hypothetical protein
LLVIALYSYTLRVSMASTLKAQLAACQAAVDNFCAAGGARSAQIFDHSRLSGGSVEGAVYHFQPNDVIKANSPLFLSPQRLFAFTCVVKINNYVDDREVLRQIPKICEHFKQSTAKPFSLVKDGATVGKDSQVWMPQLGERGFIGFYKAEKTRSTSDYFLVVHADSDYVGKELTEKFVKPNVGVMSYGQLLASSAYRIAENYSERNALRILADVASRLQMKISVRDDIRAYCNPATFDAPPDLAVPSYQACYNVLHHIRHIQAMLGYFSRTCSLSHCRGDYVPYLVDPCYGLELYRKDGSQPHSGGWHNKFHGAFPIGTGRVRHEPTKHITEGRRKAQRDKQQADYIEQIVFWHGRGKTSALSLDRLFVYADYSEGRRKLHREHLGAEHGSQRLVPVGLILPPSAV